jgi:diaminopropionate ammonia-lyase
MPTGTVKARIDSIESEEAKVFVINGTYDDCVKRVSLEVKKNKWVEVADTAYKGYTKIPSWILNGYTTIFREMEETINLNDKVNVDYVFLQAGVGAFAAAGASYYVRKYLKKRPALICIEPQEAAGFLDSIEFGKGQPIAAKGKMETIMAGLNCGIPSLVAWPILKDSINLFIAISDKYSEDAMAEYFKEGIIAGESGASGLAGLIALLRDKNLKHAKNKLKITKKSRVLVINTEKDTDPENYRRILSKMGLK